jgi:hypothetical protein
VRRGDRSSNAVNMTEFCRDPLNKDSDFGCSSVPFSLVTLQHVVDSAAKLVDPSVRTIIVTTDDEAWLDKQREELRATRPEWKVLNLRAPHHHHAAAVASATGSNAGGSNAGGSDGSGGGSAGEAEKPESELDAYEYMRSGAGTESGVLLHGSIELSRQCEAFVGHFGCGGTMLVYKSLCARHNHHEYVCPPSFDVRTIDELRVLK